MLSALAEGIIMGLFLSVFIGPVFFLLIETSIKKGVKEAFIMDAGVLLSDLLWVLVLAWGMDKFLGFFLKSDYSMIFAGVIFILFGLGALISRKRKKSTLVISKKRGLFLQGFVLNSINPSVAIFWLATIGFAMNQFEQKQNEIVVFFVSIFITVILIDIVKFSMANKMGRLLNDKRQAMMSVFTSVALILFGIYMILSNSIL